MMDAGQDAGLSQEFDGQRFDGQQFDGQGFDGQGFDGDDLAGLRSTTAASRKMVQMVPALPPDAGPNAGPVNGPNDGRSAGVDLPATPSDLAALQALASRMRIGPGSDAGGSDQAMTIARQVADMAQGLAALADRLVGQGAAPAAENIDVAEGDCVAFLESQFRIRRLRARHLPSLSLGEPAWDILLDLAVAQYWRRETSVTSLCIAADVPSTTALRWINSMTREGLIVRRPCQRDGRRSFLAIAPETYQAMLAMAADSLRTEQRVRQRYQRDAA